MSVVISCSFYNAYLFIHFNFNLVFYLKRGLFDEIYLGVGGDDGMMGREDVKRCLEIGTYVGKRI